MKLVIAKHIHSCCAAVATGDVWLYRIIENVALDDVNKHVKKFGTISETTSDVIANIITVYIGADKTFYDKALSVKGMPHYADTPEFKALVAQYKDEGWVEEPEDVREARIAQYERDEAAEAIEREKAGYVFPSSEHKKRENSYNGGFSQELLSVPQLAKYIKAGGAFGYIGHFNRKFVLDTFLEEEFMKLRTPKGFRKRNILASWLTSTDGRHFGNTLEELSDIEAKARIKQRLPEIFNLGLIYSRKEHEGTWESTPKIREKYADKLLVVGE